MTGVEVRLPGGGWTTISIEEARAYLERSIDFIRHYDLIETPPNRMQILDLAIPAFLEAIPRFGGMLASMNGLDGKPRIDVVLDGITAVLHKLPPVIDLWDWPATPANRNALSAAFASCRFPSYGAAAITKMLHLKRPRLIAPIDTRLRRAWIVPYRERWTFEGLVDLTFDIGRELGQRRSTLACLKGIADELGQPYSSLSLLRLYDILSWWMGEP